MAPEMCDGPTTPSPPTQRLQTPPAPRLGYLDSWDPYATPGPRKSTRLSSQRTAKRTASPNALNRQPHPRSPEKASHKSSPPDMPKKRQPAPDTVHRAASSAAPEGVKGADSKAKAPRRTNLSRTKDMLLTPSKTPRKREHEKVAPKLGTVARELFTTAAKDDELLLSPKKRAKKYTGISLESFTAEEIEEPIDIFTDSRDRIPSKDESEENPFYGEVVAPEPKKRRSKRTVKIPGEGLQSLDEASRREDGMLYVFRGKKFFRKFSQEDPDDLDELQDEEFDETELNLSRPLRRSGIKPRLLFQTPKTPAMLEEEEAPTDVEDLPAEEEEEEEEDEDVEEAMPQTPVKSQGIREKTPEAPRFAPVSPPDTRRTTRSMNKLVDEGTPMRKYNVRRTSTFDSWRRTKDSGRAAPKRAAEDLTTGTSKRTRT